MRRSSADKCYGKYVMETPNHQITGDHSGFITTDGKTQYQRAHRGNTVNRIPHTRHRSGQFESIEDYNSIKYSRGAKDYQSKYRKLKEKFKTLASDIVNKKGTLMSIKK
jgi:hypothetical protein